MSDLNVVFDLAKKLDVELSDLLPAVVDVADGDGLKPETKKVLAEVFVQKLLPLLVTYLVSELKDRAPEKPADGSEPDFGDFDFAPPEDDIKPPAQLPQRKVSDLELGVTWLAFQSKLYGRDTDYYKDRVSGREAVNNRTTFKLDVTAIDGDYRFQAEDSVRAGHSFKPEFFVWVDGPARAEDLKDSDRYSRFYSDPTRIKDREDGTKGLEPSREDSQGGVAFAFGGAANFQSKGHSPRGKVFEEGQLKIQARLDGVYSNVLTFKVK